MVYDYFDLVKKTQHWAEQAHASGWINDATVQQLSEVDTRTPTALFNESNARPLIVAFMGGTGVGKSSLLNRLAGKAIARTGVERPTSHEVTLFHHRDITIGHLPDKCPIDSAKIAQHDDESRKNIVWIDMPDFDSIEQNNKDLVLAWLPHIDVLIYVVSPERYRDDKEWRLLISEGGRHAWLFAFNQWDKGYPEQFQDFQQQLHKAGFLDPIIFKTVCASHLESDEFAILQTTLCSLATEHTIKHLEQRSLQIKRNELKATMQQCEQLLGAEQSFQQTFELWHNQWQKTTNLLQQGFAWPIKQLANHYAEHASDLITNTHLNPNSLWDAWAQTRFNDALNEFVTDADQFAIPVSPLKKQLSSLHEKVTTIIQANTELAVRQSLANPGNLLQRNFLKIIRLLEIILPLSSISWVGYQVFIGYYNSSISNTHYLGVDFAVHSSLLIAISWLTPFFILKKLKPSLEKSAKRGLNKGVDLSMAEISNLVLEVLKQISDQHRVQKAQISEIIEQCSTFESTQPSDKSPVTRMLIDSPS